MATDYDTPRSIEGEEDQEQSLEALKARRAEAAADLGDDADPRPLTGRRPPELRTVATSAYHAAHGPKPAS